MKWFQAQGLSSIWLRGGYVLGVQLWLFFKSLFKTPVTMEATRPGHTSKGCTYVCSSTTLISVHITITCTHPCNTHNSILSGGCRDQRGHFFFLHVCTTIFLITLPIRFPGLSCYHKFSLSTHYAKLLHVQ